MSAGVPGPDAATAALFEAVRRAYIGNDHAALAAVASDKMKEVVGPDRLAASSLTLGPLLADPSRLSYMGVLKEGEHAVHFWKADSGASRDVLVRLGVKDGKVSGLLFSAAFDTGLRK